MPMSRTIRKLDRAIELGPQLVRKPGHVRQVLRGLHPGSLTTLDKPWLRELDFDVVLDVGANTGQFAQVARYVFPRARIFSFEPLPECVEDISRRMRGDAAFRVFASAVGSEDGTVTMHQSASSPSSSILSMTEEHTSAFPWSEGGTDLEVAIHRLDHYLPEIELQGRVLLKIDVQGFAMEVLRGATETLPLVDTVFIEASFVQLYAGEASFDDVYTFMKEAGFEFVGLLDQLEHPASRRSLQGDAIFRRRA